MFSFLTKTRGHQSIQYRHNVATADAGARTGNRREPYYVNFVLSVRLWSREIEMTRGGGNHFYANRIKLSAV